MRQNLAIVFFVLLLTSCGVFKPARDRSGQSTTQGDPKNAQSFGYQPLDPLPVEVLLNQGSSNDTIRRLPYNTRVMNSLPDETMRLAIGEIDASSNISFGTAKLGYAGNSYVVILDYIKFDTKSFPTKIFKVKEDGSGISKAVADTIGFMPLDSGSVDRPDAVLPVYVGVGLRLTATITVNKGSVDLGNLFALGVAAEAKQITGTLVIQTLGISGENISSIIPMPNQINTTTIQNAIMALGSIKAKMYQTEVRVNPRIVGFYNNVGGGKATVNQFISTFLSGKVMEHKVQ
jgi:hypothetical protein